MIKITRFVPAMTEVEMTFDCETIEQARESINLMKAMDRLRLNSDFKDIIEVGYLEKEPTRIVAALADPVLQSEENQTQLNKMIIGIGYFRQYLNRIYQIGHQAEMAMNSHEQTREEILSEDA